MITILTEPTLNKVYNIKKAGKRLIKKHVLKKGTPLYAGHFAVVRSLIDGLNKIGASYNYNPATLSNLGDHVHVLANLNALELGIALKKQGKIKRLTAGPNIVISSAEANGIIASKEIDRYFVNSEWTKNAYLLDNPLLKGRIGIWAAGVDAADWHVKRKKHKKPVIVFYNKRPEHFLYERCKELAKKKGFELREIIYGKYDHIKLKENLAEADAVAYFVEQESQGITLQEIWSCDVPTFVWNPGIWMYKNVNYACCSAPYLTKKTGVFFRDEKEFENAIGSALTDFSPRKWLLSHMTDEICAADFLKKISNDI
jgi:hypothetical protein